MNDRVAQQLLSLNRAFYNEFAAPFDRSRLEPQPGFNVVADWMPDGVPASMLDVGCGNGRFGFFWDRLSRLRRYVGVDFSDELLQRAMGHKDGQAWSNLKPSDILFFERDMSQLGFLNGIDNFDFVVCLSAMQHIPQRIRRAQLLSEMSKHLFEDGYLLLGNWQFIDSERQRRKILPWDEIGLDENDVESGDYLLSWNRGGIGRRYVCLIDEEETSHLAQLANLRIVHQFRADGREENLNLYTILQRK